MVSQAPQQAVRLLPKLWKQVGKAFGWSYRHILRNPNVGSTDPCLHACMALTHLPEFNSSPWWQRGVALGVCAIIAVTVAVEHRTSCSKHITSDLHTLSHLNFTTDSYQYPLFKKRKLRLNNLPLVIERLAACGTSCHHTVSLFLIGGSSIRASQPQTQRCASPIASGHEITPWRMDEVTKNIPWASIFWVQRQVHESQIQDLTPLQGVRETVQIGSRLKFPFGYDFLSFWS